MLDVLGVIIIGAACAIVACIAVIVVGLTAIFARHIKRVLFDKRSFFS